MGKFVGVWKLKKLRGRMKRLSMMAGLLLFVMTAGAQQYRIPVQEIHEQMQTGQYEPTWESLETHETPEWFRDAKFGIWAHWGAQCVEGSGDWMARGLYLEGGGQYNYHREHYGHPSEFGYKDILPLFKAEKWDPEALVERYKRCGAQYFFVLGNHHDNYDLWDSKYQPWNSKNIGPKRDILDEWSKAAKKVGLPLGISFHADHAWTWFEPSQRYDLKGDKAGIYYDGNLTKEDGKGKWWEGLDPQMLYQQNHPMSKGSWDNGAIHSQWGWDNGACPPSQEFVTNFFDRTIDAINRYNPDLIYFDVTVLPFYPLSDCGLKIATHLYNKNPRGVVFGKILNDEQKKANAWEFIKWWTGADAQARFGREMESILGASARYTTANRDALKQLAWSTKRLKILQDQMEHTQGFPEIAGGYSTTRHLINACRKVINTKEDQRETLLSYARTINEEIRIKRREFNLPVD